MPLIVAETGSFLDYVEPDSYLATEARMWRAGVLNSLNRLPNQVKGLDIGRVTDFLGAICVDTSSLSLLVTDTSTPEAQQVLLESGISSFTKPKPDGGTTVPAVTSIVDRKPHDAPRGIEWVAIHELTHQGANVFVRKHDIWVDMSPPGLTGASESGQPQNFWEEGRAQLNAAAYDKLYYPAEQGSTTRISDIAIPDRYLLHPSRANFVAESGLAATALELLISQDVAVLDHMVGAEKWIGSWYFLREKINRLAPREVDLFDRIHNLPPDASGYTRGLKEVMDTVYPNGDYPQGEELGRVSSKYYAEAVRKHTDRSSLRGKIHHALIRWLGASDYEGRTI